MTDEAGKQSEKLITLWEQLHLFWTELWEATRLQDRVGSGPVNLSVDLDFVDSLDRCKEAATLADKEDLDTEPLLVMSRELWVLQRRKQLQLSRQKQRLDAAGGPTLLTGGPPPIPLPREEVDELCRTAKRAEVSVRQLQLKLNREPPDSEAPEEETAGAEAIPKVQPDDDEWLQIPKAAERVPGVTTHMIYGWRRRSNPIKTQTIANRLHVRLGDVREWATVEKKKPPPRRQSSTPTDTHRRRRRQGPSSG